MTLCADMQRVKNPLCPSADYPHCMHTGTTTLRARCEFNGCFWRKWHMLDGQFAHKQTRKVPLAIDAMLL